MFSFTSNQRKAILFFFFRNEIYFSIYKTSQDKKKKVIMLRVSESVGKWALSYMGGG